MRVCTTLAGLREIEHPIVLGSGVFDGIHLGHQAILAHTQELAAANRAQPAVLTFHPHPACVLRPAACPRYLTTRAQKHRLLAAQQIDWLIELPFTAEFAQLSGEEFVRQLVLALPDRLRGWCAGESWSFGHRRSGHMDLLRVLGQEVGFVVQAVAPIDYEGKVVSSTRIRQAVAAGHMDEARALLGRPFALPGVVATGARLGRRLGFPTANVRPDPLQQLPPTGVYAGFVALNDRRLPAAINLGNRPTVDPHCNELLLEAHLLDWSGDIYGEEIEILLMDRVRSEQKFASVEALREQIRADIQQVRRLLPCASV